ncbi:MAG: VTT domain-containing protein [Candidatus Aenigmarchaeota archaeon]|nr:VTT domain-containing protein [Candidatus Aenigmarchaeota archaeon]
MALETFLSLIQGHTIISYIAIFLSSFIGSSTFLVPIIPIPSYVPILFGIAEGLNPLMVGLIAGAGSAMGDVIGYFIGLGGSTAIETIRHKTPKFLKRFEKFFSGIGFWTVLTFAFIPFPFDIIGAMSGASKYEFKKFLLALMIGRIARSLLLAYTGMWILSWIDGFFT